MKKEPAVTRDPEVLSGALVFAGTRVPAETLIDYLKSGALKHFNEFEMP